VERVFSEVELPLNGVLGTLWLAVDCAQLLRLARGGSMAVRILLAPTEFVFLYGRREASPPFLSLGLVEGSSIDDDNAFPVFRLDVLWRTGLAL